MIAAQVVENETILHVYDYLHPRSGGPPQVILNLARAQQRRGARIRLISYDARDPEVQASVSAMLEDVEPIELRPRWIRPLCSRRRIDHALEGVTAVHLHSIWPTPNLFVAHRCLQRGIPYVLSVHGHLRREALEIKPLKKRVGLALGYRAMLRGASGLHALTESEASDIRAFGLTTPSVVIPNGIALPEAERPPDRAAFTSQLPQLGDAPYLLFLSRIHPPKGALQLAQAFVALSEEYPQLHLVVAGPDFGGVEEVVGELTSAGLRSRLHLPGFLAGDAKSAALAHAEAFCLPSHHEGFSVAVLEALSWGAPTVISSGCHFPELSSEGAGWVHSIGVAPLLQTLREVLGSPEQTRARAAFGQRWVRARFQWSALERLFHQWYREHCTGSSR